jgi:hypothetical protein
MLVYFFDAMNIVHKQWVPAAKIFSQYYYTAILERLRNRVMWVSPNISKNRILHHDSAPAHTALSVAQFWASKCITVMPQSPYSPDLAHCYFFSLFFPKYGIGSESTPL